jgi:hypothetical protein
MSHERTKHVGELPDRNGEKDDARRCGLLQGDVAYGKGTRVHGIVNHDDCVGFEFAHDHLAEPTETEDTDFGTRLFHDGGDSLWLRMDELGEVQGLPDQESAVPSVPYPGSS